MLNRTRLGIKESRGLMSLKSLFDSVKVFSWFKPSNERGSSGNLLLCRSSTDRLGAFSRPVIELIKLNDSVSVSSFSDFGTALNA